MKELQSTLRFVVNQLRIGCLITPAVILKLRVDLYNAGWVQQSIPGTHGATSQEDASEFFLFLLDVLEAPYLSLLQQVVYDASVTIQDKDDRKRVRERILSLAIPVSNSNQSEVTTIEDLLYAHFFDNQVQLWLSHQGHRDECNS